MGGPPARARRAPGVPRPPGPHRPRPVRRSTGPSTCATSTSLRITGTVRPRPEGTVNPNLPTGEIEVGDCEVEVLSTAEPPPFPVDSRADDVDEIVRLRYRYLDLRRERMQRNLRLRATVNSAIRGGHGAAGLRRGRDAHAGALHPGGRPRVPRPVAPVAGLVLRPAPVAPAVQAAADGGRRGPLLPDRPLPARRGPAGRPPVRVHAARRRDELRRPGRRAGGHQRGGARRRRGRHRRAAGRRSPTSPGTRPWTATASTSPTCASAWSWSSSPTCSPPPSSRPSPGPAPSRASGCRRGPRTTGAASWTRSPTGPSSSAPRAWCG